MIPKINFKKKSSDLPTSSYFHPLLFNLKRERRLRSISNFLYYYYYLKRNCSNDVAPNLRKATTSLSSLNNLIRLFYKCSKRSLRKVQGLSQSLRFAANLPAGIP